MTKIEYIGVSDLSVQMDARLREVSERLDSGIGVVLVKNPAERIIGIITRGDFRRAMMRGISLDSAASLAMNPTFHFARPSDPEQKLIELLANPNVGGVLPLIDCDGTATSIAINPDHLDNIETCQITSICITPSTTLHETMAIIDKTGLSIALVTDENSRFLGLATDRDIRRKLLEGSSPDAPISEIMNPEAITLRQGISDEEALRTIRQRKLSDKIKVPILDDEGRVVDLIIPYAKGTKRLISDYFDIGPRERISAVLVIGGGGYIGSALVEQLLEKGYTVRVLDKFIYGKDPLKKFLTNPRLEIMEGDVRHIETIVRAIKDVDAVVHLSGIVGDPACAIDPKSTLAQNYFATMTIAQVCKFYQINRFIFASSCSVYGVGQDILTEESETNPVSLYARDKLYSEAYILSIADENFAPVILRNSTVYGLSGRPRFDLVLNVMTAHAVTKGVVNVFGGSQWRPMVHVKDVARACLLAVEAPVEKVSGQIFNVGSDEQNIQILQIAEKIKELMPKIQVNVDEKDVDCRDYRVDFKKIRETLGFTPKHTLESGILEIKTALESGEIPEFSDVKYNNYKFLTNANPTQ